MMIAHHTLTQLFTAMLKTNKQNVKILLKKEKI